MFALDADVKFVTAVLGTLLLPSSIRERVIAVGFLISLFCVVEGEFILNPIKIKNNEPQLLVVVVAKLTLREVYSHILVKRVRIQNGYKGQRTSSDLC